MKLSNKQKILLHIVPDAMGVTDAERRVVQRNVGGFYSAADRTCTRVGFIAVMAFYESRAPAGAIPGFTAGYWVGQAEKAGPNDTMIHRIDAEAAGMGWDRDKTDRFLAGKHMSSGRYGSVTEAPPYWLRRLLEAIKAIRKRAAIEA